MSRATELLERLSGVIAVPVTPFTPRGVGIDAQALEALIGCLDSSGIQAIATLGNTAEVHQLTLNERREVVRLAASARSNAALLAGLAGPLSAQLELAAWAAEHGFDAVMAHEPADPGGCAEGILAFLHRLADESPLPVVPYVRTPRLSDSALGELIAHPKIVAVKYAVPDIDRATVLMTTSGLESQTLWVCGLAESWVPAFAHLGMRGFTSGLANVQPELALAMLAAVQEANWAEVNTLLELVAPFESLRNRDGGRHSVAVLKAALNMRGASEPDVRPPTAPLDAATENALGLILSRWTAFATSATVAIASDT
jgi:4-hydroxy-tetrahydrodipicolinate synthase